MLNYICEACGATGVKLWREYQTFLDHQRLLCMACACKDQEKVRTPTEDGKSLYTGEVFHFARPAGWEPRSGRSYDPAIGPPPGTVEVWEHREKCDQIGWLVPAVPTIEGDTYWGYTSVPQDRCEWWYALPYAKEQAAALERTT